VGLQKHFVRFKIKNNLTQSVQRYETRKTIVRRQEREAETARKTHNCFSVALSIVLWSYICFKNFMMIMTEAMLLQPITLLSEFVRCVHAA